MIDDTIRFFSPQGGQMGFGGMISEITTFIGQDPRKSYKVIVGSDTSAPSREPFTTSVITVVIVWRVGHGATYFWTRGEPKMFYSLHERIIAETMASITLAQEVRSQLKDTLGDEFLWDGNEIHTDIGNGGESREFIREVTGIIKGFDFVPVIKPEAWCASTVADRHTG